MNRTALPPVIGGVRVLHGVEIDIVDFAGHLAFCDCFPGESGISIGERLLRSRDVVIASIHMFPGFRDGTSAQNTEMYLAALETLMSILSDIPAVPSPL